MSHAVRETWRSKQLFFVILQNMHKNVFTFIICFYLQPDSRPLGAKHVAYHYTTNDFSYLVIH